MIAGDGCSDNDPSVLRFSAILDRLSHQPWTSMALEVMALFFLRGVGRRLAARCGRRPSGDPNHGRNSGQTESSPTASKIVFRFTYFPSLVPTHPTHAYIHPSRSKRTSYTQKLMRAQRAVEGVKVDERPNQC